MHLTGFREWNLHASHAASRSHAEISLSIYLVCEILINAYRGHPYGSLPSFDLDKFKGSFDIWLKKWNVFLTLSTINSALPEEERDE
ncbi:hypothetical protein T10_10889 [Trichinella papuae]|uniref:Uncharacterized protein n=1 Tax=Trichinella papuae TaxID=268474 RepID=A0A0V1MW45_9BILA|nr:hypothetical protein T10_10889 [Trichinella papuae]